MLNEVCTNGEKLWVKVEGKAVGFIENGVFKKSVSGSKHMLQFPEAWAIQATAYEQIKHRISAIVILDKETDTAYSISKLDFECFKFAMNRGYGRQYCVELGHWTMGEGSTHGG